MKNFIEKYTTKSLQVWILVVLAVPNVAFAGSNPFEDAADGVFDFLTGGIAVTLMGIALIGTAFAIYLGKMGWSHMMALAALILLIFSVDWILDTIEKVAT